MNWSLLGCSLRKQCIILAPEIEVPAIKIARALLPNLRASLAARPMLITLYDLAVEKHWTEKRSMAYFNFPPFTCLASTTCSVIYHLQNHGA